MALRIPRHLAKVRHQTIKSLDHTPLETLLIPEDERRLLRFHLEGAGLYWVAPPMTALAVHAGGKLDAARWSTRARPHASGLIVFDGGVGSAPIAQFDRDSLHGKAGRMARRILEVTDWDTGMPVDALTWGGHKGTCRVGMWVRRERIQEAIAAAGLPRTREGMPPLVYLLGWPLPATGEEVPFAELERSGDNVPPETILRALAAAWLLMDQPKLADRTRVPGDRSSRTTAARLGYSDPDVTVVDLRRLYVPDTREETGTEGGRKYHRRWVVDGHWRNYRHPRYSEEVRADRRWIEEYEKGPEGAPLLRTERVNVWRR